MTSNTPPASVDTPDDRLLSASVAISPIVPTSASVGIQVPDPAVVQRVQVAFRRLGFEVGLEYAGTFSITARRSLFEGVFSSWRKERFSEDALAVGTDADLELPVPDIDDAFGDDAREIQAVFFTAPPDFGPMAP